MIKNRSILWRWGLSYLCLFLIPLFSIFINYYNNEKSLKEEYRTAFALTLDNLDRTVDTYTADMIKYRNYILEDETFKRMRLYNNKNNPDIPFDAYMLQKSLSLYEDANTIQNYMIYYSNLDLAASPSFSYKLENYYHRLCLTSPWMPSYEEWVSFVTAPYENGFLISSWLHADKNPSVREIPSLIYAHTLHRSNNLCTIFVTTPLSELVSLLELLPEETFLVIQSSDHQLYTLGRNGQLMTDSPVSLDDKSRLTVPQHYMTISADAGDRGFSCHLVISERAIEKRLSDVRNNFVFTLCITLILGLISAVLLLLKNYRPVSKLLTVFDVESADGNEFQNISSSYEKLRKEYHTARTTVQYQNQELMNSWLLSLLKGRIREKDINTGKISLTLTQNTPIALVGFTIPPSSEIEYDDLLFFIVDNIFQELFTGYTFHHIEDGRFIYYLMELQDPDSWREFALEKVDYLCNMLSENWDCEVVGVVSGSADNLRSCTFLYREIMVGFEQQKISGGSTAIDTRSTDAQQMQDQTTDLIENDLDEAVKEGDLKAALNVATSIFDAIQKAPFPTQRAYVFDAFTQVLGIFNNYISNPIQQMRALDTIMPLMQADDTENLKSCFQQMLVYVCSEIAQRWQSEEKGIVSTIRKYVEDHYTDQDLSVSIIAYAIDRNPTYLSRVFKESTGEGLLDYINRYRITKAKELMQSSEPYTLTEISEHVGYANVRAFRRAFAKLVGEIPSKYNKQ